MNLPFRLLLGAATCFVAAAASSATLVRDLGQGLTYYRVHELPADLPAPPGGRPGACVVDLRFAKADELAASALKAWLRFNASPHAPIFVLENSATSPALLAAAGSGGPPGLLVVAPAGEGLSPDVAVRFAKESDSQAYQALERGTPVASLLSDNPEKPRVDEAYLEKEHLSDGDVPDAATDRPSPPSPLVDRVLQRSLQLHRGLLALKKI
jgi:hypothetical protein